MLAAHFSPTSGIWTYGLPLLPQGRSERLNIRLWWLWDNKECRLEVLPRLFGCFWWVWITMRLHLRASLMYVWMILCPSGRWRDSGSWISGVSLNISRFEFSGWYQTNQSPSAGIFPPPLPFLLPLSDGGQEGDLPFLLPLSDGGREEGK